MQHESRCGTVLSAIRIAVGVRVAMRMESIGDGCIINGVKKSGLWCAMSEMRFGEEGRGKSVRLLTSEE